MAKEDYFGYDKQSYGGDSIATSPYVLINIENKEIVLAQSVRLTYRRDVTPYYEIGSASVWFVDGSPSGTFAIERAAGKKDKSSASLLGFYKERLDKPCKTQNLTISGKKGGDCGAGVSTVKCEGYLQEVGVSVTAGQHVVTDNATWLIGKMQLA